MYTQNGSRDRHVEALLVEVIWPEFIAQLETEYVNKLFVSLRLIDFTPGYDTNSAVLFPETVAMREIPTFTWGAIFQDREAARYRRVVRAASEITKLDLPDEAARMLDDQALTEKTFVMWDIIHDRTHMRGDLPFDPFMIKQRMPYFLYSLEELRCDLTAFRECVAIQKRLRERAESGATLDGAEAEMLEHAQLVQYAVIFDRIFRFAITGIARAQLRRARRPAAVRVAAPARRAALDRHLARFDWDEVPAAVVALGDAIDELYWRSIDRPKTAHWLAAYELVRGDADAEPRFGVGARPAATRCSPARRRATPTPCMDDEFPLSMFFEALEKKMRPVIESTAGIRGDEAERTCQERRRAGVSRAGRAHRGSDERGRTRGRRALWRGRARASSPSAATAQLAALEAMCRA